MRRASLLLFCAAAAAGAADLSSVRSVYVMTMSRGMDQYLANRLTNDHVFQVVTDPKAAEAILTDHIGASFEQELDQLIPPPEPPKKAEPAPEKEKDKKAKDKDAAQGPLLPIDPDAKLPPVRSTFNTGKGTLFLVDPKSHEVLWSTYDPARGSASKDMDRTASDIVSRLKKDLKR